MAKNRSYSMECADQSTADRQGRYWATSEENRLDCWFSGRANDYRQIGAQRPSGAQTDWLVWDFEFLWQTIRSRIYKRIIGIQSGRLASGQQGRRNAPKASAARSATQGQCQQTAQFRKERGKRRFARRRSAGSLSGHAARQDTDDLASVAIFWLWAKFYPARRSGSLARPISRSSGLCWQEIALRSASAASCAKAIRRVEYGQRWQYGRLADTLFESLPETAEADLTYRPDGAQRPIWSDLSEADLLNGLCRAIKPLKRSGRLLAIYECLASDVHWTDDLRPDYDSIGQQIGASGKTIRRELQRIRQIGQTVLDDLAETLPDRLADLLADDLPIKAEESNQDREAETLLWPLPEDHSGQIPTYRPAEARVALADRARRLADAKARGQTEASRSAEARRLASDRLEAYRQTINRPLPAENDLRPVYTCQQIVSVDDLRPVPGSLRADALDIARRRPRQCVSDLDKITASASQTEDMSGLNPMLSRPEAELSPDEITRVSGYRCPIYTPSADQTARPDNPTIGQTIWPDRAPIRSAKRRRKAMRKDLARRLLAINARRRPIAMPAYNPATDLLVTIRYWPDDQRPEVLEWATADLAYSYATRHNASLMVLHG